MKAIIIIRSLKRGDIMGSWENKGVRKILTYGKFLIISVSSSL